MKVRVKFAKLGNMKYIGHLDVMRFFQKAIRRSDIDIVYSQGYSPHQIMSFASPLGVGNQSVGEYMDLELKSTGTSAEMLEKLNAQMAPGIEVLSIIELDEDSKNAMSIVAAADYEVTIKEEYAKYMDLNKIHEFYKLPFINILKKSKKSEKEINIKPLIYNLFIKNDSIIMTLAAGSSMNLKPELVMEAFFEFSGMQINDFALQIKRLDIYADTGDEQMRNLVPLNSLGKEII